MDKNYVIPLIFLGFCILISQIFIGPDKDVKITFYLVMFLLYLSIYNIYTGNYVIEDVIENKIDIELKQSKHPYIETNRFIVKTNRPNYLDVVDLENYKVKINIPEFSLLNIRSV